MPDQILDTYNIDKNNNSLNFEFFPIPYETLNRQFPLPFIPGGPVPFGGYPYSPYNNYPGGIIPPQGMPSNPPPDYIPSKEDKGVQNVKDSSDNNKSKNDNSKSNYVSPSSIRFCLYKYTYIWENNGRSYWAYLINIDRYSLSGFRWLGSIWVYFGLDLRQVDSFFCQYYRNDNEQSSTLSAENSDKNKSTEDICLSSSLKREYSHNNDREIFSAVLLSIDIPETKNDYLSQTIGYVDNKTITTNIPYTTIRNITYKITLEVSYPYNYNKKIKDVIINNAASSASTACISLNKYRMHYTWSNPIDSFCSCAKLIPKILKSFTQILYKKLESVNVPKIDIENIKCAIRKEKVIDDWKSYFNNKGV